MTVTRRIDSADDLDGSWFVVGERVVRLGEEVVGRQRPAGAGRPTGERGEPDVILANGQHLRRGVELELASGSDLDDAFRSSVRSRWSFLVGALGGLVLLVLLDVSGVPWREALGGGIVPTVAAALVGAIVGQVVLRAATRRAEGRVTRALAGGLRRAYDRQRAID